MRKLVLFALAGALFLGASSTAALSNTPADPLAFTVHQQQAQDPVFANRPHEERLAGGYCNGYGCFGNVCYTPAGSCFQVNFSLVGGSRICPGGYYGTTGQ